jgi:hypothetical protein
MDSIYRRFRLFLSRHPLIYLLLKKIRYLTVRFDALLDRHELPAFRGAIAAIAGSEHPLFHNHDDREPGGVIYRYPAIQYKRVGRSPLIVCLEAGVDEIHHPTVSLPAE